MSHTISSSDLKRQLGAWLDWIGRTREELVIETYGRPVAVLIAHEEYAEYLAFRQARGDRPRRFISPPALTRPSGHDVEALTASARPVSYATSE